MAGDRMDPAISYSLGAVGTVLGQLDRLNKSGKSLPRGITKSELEGLTKDLKEISASFMDLLKEEDSSFTDKCWMKEMREIFYDVEDYLHTGLHPSAGVRKMKLRRLIAEDISELRARLHRETKRRERCQLPRFRARLQEDSRERRQLALAGYESIVKSMLRTPCAVLDERLNELVDLLALDREQKLKVVPIFGGAGVGKTTLARRLYHHCEGRFHCRAFLRVSRNPDTRRLLASLHSQIKGPQHQSCCDVQDLTINVNEHLRGKTYLIIIDDLWATSVWDIISRAFPDGDYYSRILTTTQIEDVALACCSYYSNNMYEMRPFSYNQLQQLSFSTAEGMKDVLNHIYNDLPAHLKTCLLYFNMYPEDYVIRKDDLVKQWVAEGFLGEVDGQGREELAGSYFDELLTRGMIQPVETNYCNEVLSCTVHHMVLDLLKCKSVDENFITVVEYFETVTGFPDNVRRLSLKFGGAEGAQVPENFRMFQVRSLLFSGFFKCIPSIVKYMFLRVLILHVWADHVKKSLDLARICELFLLRYLNIECNILVKLPEQMRGLQFLETLEVKARVDSVPPDIVCLQCLSHLHLPGGTDLPNGIGRLTSLRSLGYFDLSTSSRDNLLDLGKLTNLQDLHLICSSVFSYSVFTLKYALPKIKDNMELLASILGKISNLRSLVLDGGPSSRESISCDSLSSVSPAPALLETLDLSPRVCIVSSLPRWIRELRKLRILKIALQELSDDDVNILKGLPALAALSMYVRTAPAQRIVFNEEFSVLKHFKFICTAQCVAFTGTMHTVQRLKLGFNAKTMKQFSPVDAGFNHLTGLEVFSAKIGVVGADESGRAAVQFALQEAFTQHRSPPVINIQWVDLTFDTEDTEQQDDSRIFLPIRFSSHKKDTESSSITQKPGEHKKMGTEEKSYQTLTQEKIRIVEQDMNEPHSVQVKEPGEDTGTQAVSGTTSMVPSSHIQNTDCAGAQVDRLFNKTEKAVVQVQPDADVQALWRLSDNFAGAFRFPDDLAFFADVCIAVPGAPDLWAHRWVLCARSPFLRNVFVSRAGGGGAEGDKMELRELLGEELDVGYEALRLVLEFLYSGRVSDQPKAACVCADEDWCAHVGCRPAVAFMAQVLFTASTFEVAELTSLFQRRLLDVLDNIEVDNLPLILYVANLCNESCTKLLERCLEMIVRSNLDMITLEKALHPYVTKQIVEARISLGLVSSEDKGFPNLHVRRIHRALDSDDVELVRMLLKEGKTNLDAAYALHYAVEHCNQKTTLDLLDLALADVNHRNQRGYTVLHIAAMRREPKIIASLLIKGARPSDLTFDHRNAVQISKRLTKHGDYFGLTEDGQPSNKDRLCIEILEQAEGEHTQLGEASVSLALGGDCLRRRLLYLENRVGLSRILFPMEAKVAMDIAHVDGTLEFTLGPSNLPAEIQQTIVDLNDIPFKFKDQHLARMKALSKTVELEKRFFPRCSKVLDKIMDDETELASLGKDTTTQKKRRFHDLQDVLQKAFSEDKDDSDKSRLYLNPHHPH